MNQILARLHRYGDPDRWPGESQQANIRLGFVTEPVTAERASSKWRFRAVGDGCDAFRAASAAASGSGVSALLRRRITSSGKLG